MKPDLASAIHLLHRAPFGALATQSSQMAGYPFATALPFVTDEAHCPVFLLSGLAEHTKNLLANPHASLLVTAPHDDNVLEAPRMTLVGDVNRFEASAELQARYVRYQPHAAQYLELGDFSFFRLAPKRARYIGGFAQMGWLEQDAWGQAQALVPDAEAALLRDLANDIPAAIQLMGVDCYGIDFMRNGSRERYPFDSPLAIDSIRAGIMRFLDA
jgi:heme iron utilization protein